MNHELLEKIYNLMVNLKDFDLFYNTDMLGDFVDLIHKQLE
jgi:hypothetical protein